LTVLCCHLGRAAEAEALLPEVRALVAELANDIDAIRLLWLEGKIASHLGRWQEALDKLARVCRAFAERRMGYDAALASLELAAVHLEVGDTAAAKAIAREVLPIFQGYEVDREALASLLVFCQAAERDAATAGLARRLAAELARAPHAAQPAA
jgi:hypothetical protein